MSSLLFWWIHFSHYVLFPSHNDFRSHCRQRRNISCCWCGLRLMSERWSQRCSEADLQFDIYRVKWLINNAGSPVTFAESNVASQDHTREPSRKKKLKSPRGSVQSELSFVANRNRHLCSVHVQNPLSGSTEVKQDPVLQPRSRPRLSTGKSSYRFRCTNQVATEQTFTQYPQLEFLKDSLTMRSLEVQTAYEPVCWGLGHQRYTLL